MSEATAANLENYAFESDWGRTVRVQERHGSAYGGRPLIGRDTPIDGGVYCGTGIREAIVVDRVKYPSEFNDWYDESKDRAVSGGEIQKQKILKGIYDTVRSNMRYSERGVGQLVEQISGDRLEPKIQLNHFMREGVGVCRHQALAVGALTEMFIDDGFIRGRVSVDRNGTYLGAHAWARYTSYSGTVVISDVAQNYHGTLDAAAHQAQWNYRRPED